LTSDYCGQLPLPIDWTAEFEPGAKMYQRCIPQIFRDMNSITKIQSELLSIANKTRSDVTDDWEVVHIETATGEYDHEKEILEGVGFAMGLTAEDFTLIMPGREFDTPMGYYDELGLEYLWKYVDNALARTPRERLFLGWMSTTTHTPFVISPEWIEKSYQHFTQDDAEWGSMDAWLNAVRWTDDKVKEIILGFRERGLENETLFLMYIPPPPSQF
jgi:Sulfatase